MVRLSIEKSEIPVMSKLIQERKWYTHIVESVRKSVTTLPKDISIAIIGDEHIRTINKQSRGLDRITDVLSFLYAPQEGEIVVCASQAARQYKRFGSETLIHEMQRLIVHGCLHLAGYDHHTRKEKNSMERLTASILAIL